MWDKYLRRLILVSVYNCLYSQYSGLDTTVLTDFKDNPEWIQLLLTATDCRKDEYALIEAKFSSLWDDFLVSRTDFELVIEPKLNAKQKTYTLLRAVFYTYMLEKQDLDLHADKDLKALINIYLKVLQQFGANENRQFAHAILAKLEINNQIEDSANGLDKDSEKPINGNTKI
jgi:hypothetical protein